MSFDTKWICGNCGRGGHKLGLRREYVVDLGARSQGPYISSEGARRVQEQLGGVVKCRWVGEWTIIPKKPVE